MLNVFKIEVYLSNGQIILTCGFYCYTVVYIRPLLVFHFNGKPNMGWHQRGPNGAQKNAPKEVTSFCGGCGRAGGGDIFFSSEKNIFLCGGGVSREVRPPPSIHF